MFGGAGEDAGSERPLSSSRGGPSPGGLTQLSMDISIGGGVGVGRGDGLLTPHFASSDDAGSSATSAGLASLSGAPNQRDFMGNDNALAGATLQRASSAPPVSDNVFGWAQMGFNNSGGMPLAEAGTGVRGGEPGDAPSEYYYYYYAPHSLNPRQPQPQHGGASAVASSLALEGYDDRASPGIPGSHLDPPLQTFHPASGRAPSPAGESKSIMDLIRQEGEGAPSAGRGLRSGAGSSTGSSSGGLLGGLEAPHALRRNASLGQVGRGLGGHATGVAVNVAGGGQWSGHAGPRTRTPDVMDSLDASLQGLGLGDAPAPSPLLPHSRALSHDSLSLAAAASAGQYGGGGREGGHLHAAPLPHHPYKPLAAPHYEYDDLHQPHSSLYGSRQQQQQQQLEESHDSRGGHRGGERSAKHDVRMNPLLDDPRLPLVEGRGSPLPEGYYTTAASLPSGPVYVDPRDPRLAYRVGIPASSAYSDQLYPHEVDARRRLGGAELIPVVPLGGHHHPGLAYYHGDPRMPVHGSHEPMYIRAYPGGYDSRDGDLRMKYPKDRHMRDDRDRRDRGGSGMRDRDRGRSMVSSGGAGSGTGSLLEEFRASFGKSRRWELRDLQGHIVQFCRDQHGSRFIQQRLEVATPEEKSMFFQEILPHAQSLMTDVFGNYVIQKLFDHGTLQQQEGLASFLVGHAVQLSLQMYGCRVVQKALEFATLDTLIELVAEFHGHVMKCVQDQNGNHVIQKCIEVVSAMAVERREPVLHQNIQFIIDAFINQVQKLSTHAYGCRVIQRILEHCVESQKDAVLAEIRTSFSGLIQDQYGNYVIQHVLKHGRPEDREILMRDVKANLLPYSQHKFASNVVEKCLQYGTTSERKDIVEHLLHAPRAEGQPSLLQTMVCDPYANYVVQKIIDVADEEQREDIITEIRAHASQLKRYTFGKHIISRLEKLSGKTL